MSNYGQHFSTLKTSQVEQARGDQVQNNAGGFVFAIDRWSQFDRWLILGSAEGTFYVSEKKLTIENAKVIVECVREDGPRAIARIVDVSHRGLAVKNDQAIFALAIASGADDPATRKLALEALPKVCRIATHLFHYARDVAGFRRWGRSLRAAVAKWYTDQPADKLANQLVKYRQRDGWGHRDLFRLAHPKAKTPEQHALFRYAVAGSSATALDDRIVKRGSDSKIYGSVDALPPFIMAFEELQKTDNENRVCELIRDHDLTHEMLPTQWKNSIHVWDALLPEMPMTALIRNLGKMTEIGLLKPMSAATKIAAAKLTDAVALKKGRVHPMTILLALKVYQQGRGEKGALHWSPEREIVDALGAAFYMAFETVEPTGKNTLIALDVSGSMGDKIAGMPLSCREASAAIAMVVARTEKNWHLFGFGNTFVPLSISPRERLDDVIRTISDLPFQSTDCSLPMVYATQKKLDVDTFVVLTDNETYAGSIHPFQALEQYRHQSGRAAKSVVLAMTASRFSIANPSDAGMLDVCGLSADVPTIIANFSRG